MKFPEQYRIPTGNNPSGGGAFIIPHKTTLDKFQFIVIASNGKGWEHVSVSIKDRRRCPKWEEMCLIKDLFWDKNQTVIQYHPPESQYVNNHPYCLHMWRKTDYEFPLPPTIMVGIKPETQKTIM